ncbi:hypothetical protein [Deinococcus malanensis]|nr:hypothetical protein [Deinococcus malanensis]
MLTPADQRPPDLVPDAIIDVFERYAPCSVDLGAMFPARVLMAWRAPVHVRIPPKEAWRGTSPARIGGPVPEPDQEDRRDGSVVPHQGGLLITHRAGKPEEHTTWVIDPGHVDALARALIAGNARQLVVVFGPDALRVVEVAQAMTPHHEPAFRVMGW